MYKLLPEKYIAGLKREYRFRLVTEVLFFISLAVLIGIVALVPSFVLSRAQEKQANLDMNTLKKSITIDGVDQAEKDAATIKSLIDALKGHVDQIQLSELTEAIVSARGSAISITSLDAMKDSANTAVAHLTGLSPTREALTRFKKSLESDPRFTKVELPVGDLAKSKDLRFTITAHIKW